MVVAAVPPPATPAVFELKSANLSLVSVVLKSADLDALAQAMQARFGDAPGLFDNEPVAIDLAHLSEHAEPIDYAALIELLRGHKMQPIAVRSGTPAQMEAALACGLSEAQAPVVPRAVPVLVDAVVSPPEPLAPPRATLVIDKPLRSGQRVYARGADLVVLGVVSHGAEVIADGNIHVYAPLRGRALAGAMGDTGARIFATCMEPQLLSIAGIYRTTETELGIDVLGKPAQVRLDDERLVVLPMTID
jgi:septum site-determining protein MinC